MQIRDFDNLKKIILNSPNILKTSIDKKQERLKSKNKF